MAGADNFRGNTFNLCATGVYELQVHPAVIVDSSHGVFQTSCRKAHVHSNFSVRRLPNGSDYIKRTSRRAV